jgi:hypothetical protein
VPNASHRRGSAIALALVALVVVAALGAGTMLAAREAGRSARDELAELRAATAAASSVEDVLRHWDRRRNQLAVGAFDSTGAPSDPSTVVRITRLDATRMLVEATARSRAAAPGAAGFAARTAAVIARLTRPAPNALGAVTIGGALDLTGDATVDGSDVSPSTWTGCPPSASDTVAVAAPSANAVRVAATATVRGALKSNAVAADTQTYALFGEETFASLAARADVVVDAIDGPRSPTPAGDASTCALGADAWSDPDRASGIAGCATTYPIVLARGGLALRGPARAQGVLLVDGDLDVAGSVTFAGVVIVRGAVRASLGALRVDGLLLVGGGVATSVLGAGSRVGFSRCAVTRALDGVARVGALRRRSWAEVTR